MTDNAKKIGSLIVRLQGLAYHLGRTDAAKHAVTLHSAFAELDDIAEATRNSINELYQQVIELLETVQ